MKKIVRLTESDLTRLVKRSMNEIADMRDKGYLSKISKIEKKFKEKINMFKDDFLEELLEELELIIDDIRDNIIQNQKKKMNY